MEWGVDRINAPQVWSTYNDRGENIVVGNVDTGVLYTHGALVAKYRGNHGGGNFDHNYNWWDPSQCARRGTPCDNNGHGTHTMGTMVGDDGDPGTNQIGVAPHAKWIAAKGCETNSCSTSALLSSGQFMLAPTDLNGQNPQPNLRPDIVNNSWGNVERRRHLLPGDRAGLGRVRDLPVVLERQLGAGLRNRRLAGKLRRELLGRRVRHQQRDR